MENQSLQVRIVLEIGQGSLKVNAKETNLLVVVTEVAQIGSDGKRGSKVFETHTSVGELS